MGYLAQILETAGYKEYYFSKPISLEPHIYLYFDVDEHIEIDIYIDTECIASDVRCNPFEIIQELKYLNPSWEIFYEIFITK